MSLKEFWLKVKFYGKYIFTAIGLLIGTIVGIIFLVQREKSVSKTFSKQLEDIRKQHEKDLIDLQKAKNEEAERHQLLERNYQKMLSDIEKENKTLHELIKSEDSKKIKQILEETGGDPVKTSERFSTLFGIPVSL